MSVGIPTSPGPPVRVRVPVREREDPQGLYDNDNDRSTKYAHLGHATGNKAPDHAAIHADADHKPPVQLAAALGPLIFSDPPKTRSGAQSNGARVKYGVELEHHEMSPGDVTRSGQAGHMAEAHYDADRQSHRDGANELGRGVLGDDHQMDSSIYDDTVIVEPTPATSPPAGGLAGHLGGVAGVAGVVSAAVDHVFTPTEPAPLVGPQLEAVEMKAVEMKAVEVEAIDAQVAQHVTTLPDPKAITVADIQEHLLETYDAEARRLELEQAVHNEMLELEKRKDKDRIVPGLDNDDFNAMLRSFDKHVQKVHVCPPPYDGHIPSGLDLQPHPDEAFDLHKLNSALERFYASVVVGLLRCVHEVNRIRHWEDGGTRTAVALAVYAYAWWCNLIITTLLLFPSILVLFPTSRVYLFAPALNNTASPDQISQDDTTRIAEDKARDEWSPAGTEAKATIWAQNVQNLLVSLSTPKGGSNEAEQVTRAVQRNVDGHLQADMNKREDAGALDEDDAELSRKDKAIKMYAQPGLRIIGGLVDKWERIGK